MLNDNRDHEVAILIDLGTKSVLKRPRLLVAADKDAVVYKGLARDEH